MTAQYTIDRKQFDRAIGTFQAVGQRMADCFIDASAIELTMLQAATHLDEGRDDRSRSRPRSSGPPRAATASARALHIHGGISIDVDFPIHRYFLWLKQYEFALGSATPELLRIGRCLATRPLEALVPRCLAARAISRSLRTGSRSNGGPLITMMCSRPASR
jgi:alkylation response protein AidB-like acyl-CoA dehydrogenase